MTSERLQSIMANLNLLQTDVAVICGVTPRTVNNWYHGRQAVPRSVSLLFAAIEEKLVALDWVAHRIFADRAQEPQI